MSRTSSTGARRASFDNLGTFTRNGAGTTTTIPGGVGFSNSSSVVVAEGQLELASGGNSTGTFAVPAGSTLRFDGDTNNLNSGSTLSGAGSVTVASGTANINGTYTHTGPLSVSGGTANFSPALNNNALSVTGGVLNLNAAVERAVAHAERHDRRFGQPDRERADDVDEQRVHGQQHERHDHLQRAADDERRRPSACVLAGWC